jgi:hypothetical protein
MGELICGSGMLNYYLIGIFLKFVSKETLLLLPRLLSKLFSIDLLFRIYEFLTYFISTSSISSVLTGLKSSFVEVICPLLAVLIYVFLGFSDICLFYGDGDLSSKFILIFYITGTTGFGIFASMISCSSFC